MLHTILSCVAVCCSLLQSVAVRCSVLQCAETSDLGICCNQSCHARGLVVSHMDKSCMKSETRNPGKVSSVCACVTVAGWLWE